MQLTTALLADFAQVRDNLLFVSSGGISQLRRSQYPDKLEAYLAMMVEVHPTETERPHEVQVFVQGEDGQRIAKATSGFQVEIGDDAPVDVRTTPLTLPLVAPLANVQVPAPGRYSVEVLIDGNHLQTLPLRALQSSQPETYS